MMAVGGGRRCGRRVFVAAAIGGAMLLTGCADGAGSADEASSAASLGSDAGGATADLETTDAGGAIDPSGDGAATLVVSSDDAAADGRSMAEGDEEQPGSGAAALDAEPLQSDPTGDVPAGPPAPGDAGRDDATTDSGGTEEGADDESTGTVPVDDPTDADRPEPTADTDTSPDDGEVPNGVSGDTDVRENLSYPSASVIALDDGSTTTLSAALAGTDQPTLLWFWTPDCPTCVPESAAVADFARTHGGSIRVLGVGVGGNRADADAFVADAALDPSVLVWSQGSATHSHYNVTATPFAIMVAPNGVVMAQWRGMVPELFAFADRL